MFELRILNKKIDEDVIPQIKRHDETLYGRHDDDNDSGLKGDVTDLLKTRLSQYKYIYIAFVAVIGLVVKALWDVIFRK